MANIRKKVINVWDGGIKTSSRDNNPQISDGAQMVKGFEMYKDPKKLLPMQSWENFTTTAEKAYNIRAMGGISDTVYGVGSALSNWYGSSWDYRIRVDIQDAIHRASGLPLRFDLSTLPTDFWDNTETDLADLKITQDDGVTQVAHHVENLDHTAKTGDLWIRSSVVSVGSPTYTTEHEETGDDQFYSISGSPTEYAFAMPITLTGKEINHLLIKARKTGSPNDLVISLYDDSSGSPSTSVQTLGTINHEALKETNFNEIGLGFTSFSFTGDYWLVFSSSSPDGSNKYDIRYGSTGSSTTKDATDAGLTSWSNVDTSSTPYYNFSFYESTEADKHFYLYYGNSDAEETSYGIPSQSYTYGGRVPFEVSSSRWMFTFGDDKANNNYYSDGATGSTEAFATDPTYSDGYFGKVIRTNANVITTDQDDDVAFSGNDITLSFMLKITGNPTANLTLIDDQSGYWSIILNTSGQIEWTVNGTVGTTTATSTIGVTSNEWHLITCKFDTDSYIYIDLVEEIFDYNDGDYDGVVTNDTVRINTGTVAQIGQVWGFNTDLTLDQIKTLYYNFFREDFFSVGSQEAQTSVALQYDGVQLYKKLISSGDWEEVTNAGSPVKSLSYYPMNGFVDDSGTYFVVINSTGDTGFLYLAKLDNLTVANFTHLSLGFYQVTSNTAIQPETAIDNIQYFNKGSAAISSVGDPGVETEFTAGGIVQSMAAWRTYLAIGYNSRNIGYMNIWDLASSLATEKVNAGTGNLRIVGNASDILFGVVDNFIDDAVKSTNKPTMEVKQYVGNGRVETTHVLEIPAVITSYDDDWEKAVSNFKLFRNTQTLFYAKLPNNEAGTTFDEGFWSIGKNSKGELALALQIDTESIGDLPENVFGFAQQVFFIEKDGGIKRMSDDTYTGTALYKTLKMNEGNTEVEKKLVGVEIVTEPLEAGQSYKVYYKKAGDASRTQILTHDTEDAIAKEGTLDINEESLPNYQEIEFDIESTGGSAGLLEFNYKYEYLNNIV